MVEKKKREYLISIISNYLRTGIIVVKYCHDNAPDKKSKLICNKAIKTLESAIPHLATIKHIELLEYLYNAFIGENVFAYTMSGTIVHSSKIKEWDTEEGFIEFQKVMEERKENQLAKEKAQEETRLAIQKAKEEGKKVEMIYDKESRTVKPVIIEENKA